jgi:CBS domain-containing protein
MDTKSPPNAPPLERILGVTRSFKGVSLDTIRLLIEKARLIVLAGGGTLFRPGDEYKQAVFVLIDGAISVQRPSGYEEQAQPGDFLGLANYLDNNNYSSTVLATTQSTLMEIDAALFRELEQSRPDLFNALNRVIATKLRERSPDRSITSGVLAQPVTRVMKSPVSSCGPETTLVQAFELMQERKIGSLVVKELDDKLLGVLTYAGLAEAALLSNSAPTDSVMNAACEIAREIDPDTPLWQAEDLMKRHTVKYLIVVEEQVPIGIVSQSDVLRILISRRTTINNRIQEAASLKELAIISAQMTDVAAYAQQSNHRPSDAARLLSEAHLALQQRAIELTLRWMESKGHGPPPVGYAVLIMGSGGRKEMLLNPDQDNGIIIADPPKSEADEVNEWFERFCKRMNRNLDRVGYVLCPGDIMARNPMYRKTLSEWKKQISHVCKKPTEKAARWANVMFDFDTLFGDNNLTAELRSHALKELKEQPRLLKMMSDHDAEGKPAIGFFNQLITTTKDEQGERIDIKRNGLRIIADVARIFALQNGVAVQNTTDRLNALLRVGKLSEDFKDSVQESFEELLDLLLTHQIEQSRLGKKLDKLIDPEKLTPQSRGTLRMAMRAIKRFQERLQDDYATDIF